MKQEHSIYQVMAYSWLDSILAFKWSSFKLFLLVTANAFIKAAKTLLLYAWPLLVVAIGFISYVMCISPLMHGAAVKTHLYWIGYLFLEFMVPFTILLAVRPSVQYKNWNYFFSYWRYYLIAFLGLLIFNVVLDIPMYVVYKIAGTSDRFADLYMVFKRYLLLNPKSLFTSLFLLFSFFFYLDSDGKIGSLCASLWRGFKMLLYNYPWALIVFAGSKVLFYGLEWVHRWVVASVNADSCYVQPAYMVVSYGMLLLLACFVGNYYTKKVHDQFAIYFEV